MKNQTHIRPIDKLRLVFEYNLSREEWNSFTDQQWSQLHDEWLGLQEYLNG